MDDLEKYVLALRNTHYNKKGQATIASDDEWVDESESDDLYIDYLFEKRKVIGEKLESYLRLHGFSKISFCKKVGIPLPLLEQILNGQADDKHTFDESRALNYHRRSLFTARIFHWLLFFLKRN